jgi:Zn-finger nucleic acid-binding protein
MGLFGKKHEKKDSVINCPRDHTPMEKKTREGITIDKCPKCGGLWLDKGEMESLIRKFEAHQKKMAKKNK